MQRVCAASFFIRANSRQKVVLGMIPQALVGRGQPSSGLFTTACLGLLLVFCMESVTAAPAASRAPAPDYTDSGWQPWHGVAELSSASAVAEAGDGAMVSGDLAQVQARLVRKQAHLARDGSLELQKRRLAGQAAPPSLQTIVLMCDFSDSLLYGRWGQVPGDFPSPRQSEFYYAAHDSLYFHHFMDDVATYFASVSDGHFTLNYQVEAEVANLSEPMGFYGNHPDEGEQPFQLALDAITMLDARVDFSLFDTVILIHAGAG